MIAHQPKNLDFAEVYPRLEHMLRCGFYLYTYSNHEAYWSPGMFSLLGLAPYAIESSFDRLNDFIHPADRDRVLAAVERARTHGESYEMEFSIVDAEGNQKRLHAAIEMRCDNQGNLKEYGGVMRDITEGYVYKQALEQKVALLDKSNQNLQEFVYVASHDLQEPLRKISTFAERLKTKSGALLDDEGSNYLTRIINSGAGMQTLLDDLLSFSRLATGTARYEEVSLNKIIAGVITGLELKIEETAAKISLNEMPVIDGYPSQLKQLFSNLVGNAIKFRRPGVSPVINIDCSEVEQAGLPDALPVLPEGRGKLVKIVVTDNGIGFDQVYRERIFQIFQRLNGKAEYPGSGIGLSICKRIVENHHGVIFADSEPGSGSSFTVILPVKQT